jgi:ubiquinone/menaquinone biosynthesis C-methylase UbiE
VTPSNSWVNGPVGHIPAAHGSESQLSIRCLILRIYLQDSKDRWQVSGSAPEIYEKYLVPAVFGAWSPILLDLVSPRSGERVLDLACGTGTVARRAAELVGPTGKVVGADISAGMLMVARSIPSSGAQIEWKEADARSTPFPDGSFDILTCQLGLQFFPDRAKAVREMRRVLVPKGRLGVLVWRPIRYSPGFAVLEQALERHAGPEAAKFMRSPFSLSDAQELRNLLREAGFVHTTIRIGIGTVRFRSVDEFVSLYAKGTPLSALVSHMDEHAHSTMVENVRSGLGSYVDDEGLAFPIEGHLASATAP